MDERLSNHNKEQPLLTNYKQSKANYNTYTSHNLSNQKPSIYKTNQPKPQAHFPSTLIPTIPPTNPTIAKHVLRTGASRDRPKTQS